MRSKNLIISTLIIGMLPILIIMTSCTSSSTTSAEYVSDVSCNSASKDLGFTLSNSGSKPLSLEGSKSGSDQLSIEINGLELTGVVNYCGRSSLAPHDVVKCRRPGTSSTDAGLTLETGRRLLLFNMQNTLRAKAGGMTKTIHVSCQ